VWPATEAIRRGLVDEIQTSDKYILDLYNNNATLYEVKLKKTIKKGLLSALSGRDNNDENDDAYPPGINIVSRIIGDTMLYVFRELAQGNEIEVNTTTPNNTDC
jgi:ClpP class serine protease